MKITDIVAGYDVPGGKIEELDCLSLLRSCNEEDRTTIPYIAESYALELKEDCQSENDQFNGKFYFGPTMITKDESGNFFEYPDRNTITKEIVDYWERRILSSQNVYLKARYAGLVWDFKPFVTDEKRDFNIALTYIRSLIDSVNGDYSAHPIMSIKLIERAILLSNSFKQAELLSEAKQSLTNLISRHYQDGSIGIWGVPYRIMEKNHSVYNDAEKLELVHSLEHKFEGFYSKDPDLKQENHRDPWMLMQMAQILAEYFKKNEPPKIANYFNKVEDSFDALQGQLSRLQLIGNYSQLHHCYRKYGLDDYARKLSQKIAKIGEGVQEEMAHIKHDFTISREHIEEFNNSILSDDVERTFALFTYSFIPKIDQARVTVQELAKNTPLVFMMPTTLFDEKGRPKASIGNIENDLDGQIVHNISQSMHIGAVYLNATIYEGIKRELFTKETVLEYLKNSPAISLERMPIISKGVQAYFDGDYIVAIHLLIPQIEEALRSILDTCGIPTLKPNRNGNGFQLRILDDILRDELAKQCLTEDFASYLRILLTDNRGWNLRNEVCHGCARPALFNIITADRIFHALLCFGVFRIVETAQDTP